MPVIWALGDLHLSLGTPDKKMDVFGESWKNHPEKIKARWSELVKEKDLVLLPGDISWASRLEDAMVDLEWIDSLPGDKMMIRGNHDYWWPSLSKLKQYLPPSIQAIHNNSLLWNGIAIGGARLWDTPDYNFNSYIDFQENPLQKPSLKTKLEKEQQDAKIFHREIERLKLSLTALNPNARIRIMMTHYPPIGPTLQESKTSLLFEKHRVTSSVFGHLHNVKPASLPFGERNGIKYHLTSCDYVHFTPIEIYRL